MDEPQFQNFELVEDKLAELMTYVDDIKDSLCSLQYIELTNKVKRIREMYLHQMSHQGNALKQAIKLRNVVPAIAFTIIEHFTDEF